MYFLHKIRKEKDGAAGNYARLRHAGHVTMKNYSRNAKYMHDNYLEYNVFIMYITVTVMQRATPFLNNIK